MPVDKSWDVLKEVQVPDDFQAIIGGHPIVAQTLIRRGYRTIDAAQSFLDPDVYQTTSADELPDAVLAYHLLAKALETQSRIFVWGDFDVDGQTATATLVEGLRELGGDVRYHIPVRGVESHGIKREVLEEYLKQGFDLFLTCDTGISEHENIQYLREAGVKVIVTDHHALSETLPPANAVINPQRLPPDHPLRTLPGVGVAYKLMEGLYNFLNRDFDSGRYMALSALGIVADVAELCGDTRYLLQKGLSYLQTSQRIGLQTLYKNAGLTPQNLNEDHIGFQIAPRLNAVGRLGDANTMVELLTTEDAGRARILAAEVEALNAKRQFMTRQIEKAAESILQASVEDRLSSAIILHHPNWPGGVIGIVAGRLAERYHKPAILLTGEDPINGSARSVSGVNITQAIGTQSDLLNAYGGHPMAAGLSFPASNLNTVKRGIHSAVKDRTDGIEIQPDLQINQTLTLDEISLAFINQLERLAPFGPGNPALLFLVQDLTLVSSTAVGQQGEHRQVIVKDKNGNSQRLIWWNGGDESLPEAQFDLVCKLTKSDYKGTLQVSAEWIEFHLSDEGCQELEKRHFSIIDHRETKNPIKILQDLLIHSPQAVVWAEGNLPKDVSGKARHEIAQVNTLVVWTSPPSQAVLQDLIHQSRPDRVVLFSQAPNHDTYNGFMTRLGGLAKYAVTQKNGQTSLEHLASACAAEIETIRIGLQLYEALGKLKIEFIEDDLLITLSNAPHNQPAIEIFESILTDLLAESRAYRQYFRQGDINGIFPDGVSEQ